MEKHHGRTLWGLYAAHRAHQPLHPPPEGGGNGALRSEGPHVSCLYYLGLDGPLTAAELSERCDEDKAAVSRTLEFLLQNSYVTTEAVSRRYRSPLYLTNRGREVFAALQARIASMEDAASMGLTEEQRSKMYAALELICGNLERLCAAEQEDTL